MDIISKLTSEQAQTETERTIELLTKASAAGKTHVTVSMLDHDVVKELQKRGYEVTEEKDEDYEIRIPRMKLDLIALRDTC